MGRRRKLPCDKCEASCCKRPPRAETYINYAVELSLDEIHKFKGLYKRYDGRYVLPYNKKGECILLKDNKCSRYKDRPEICRGFICTDFFSFRGRPETFIQQRYKIIEALKKSGKLPKSYINYRLWLIGPSVYDELVKRKIECDADVIKEAIFENPNFTAKKIVKYITDNYVMV